MEDLLHIQCKFFSHSMLPTSVLFRNGQFLDPVSLNQLLNSLPFDHFQVWPSSFFSPIQCSALPTCCFKKTMSSLDSRRARVAPWCLEQKLWAKVQFFVFLEIKQHFVWYPIQSSGHEETCMLDGTEGTYWPGQLYWPTVNRKTVCFQ